MLTLASLALVSTPLLLLIASLPARTLSLETQWPYNLPPHMKYYPEDEALVRRNGGIQEKLANQKPIGVHKMSGDAGEMFFPDYWVFDKELKNAPANPQLDRRIPTSRLPNEHQHSGMLEEWANSTLLYPLQAPLNLHSDQQSESKHFLRRLHRLPRALLYQLDERDFQCPGNTISCTSINRPNSCCPTGESCQPITNIGLGDVGCCAQGQTCSQQVSSCQEGYKSCPGSSGGGCCIPGYECDGVGCALVSTATVFVNPTVTASPLSSTSTSQTPTPESTSSSVVVVAPVPSSPSSTSTSPTETSSTASSTATTTTSSSSTLPTSIPCSPGYRSCASSLGGGCCATDRACGSALCSATATESSLLASTTGASLNIAVRPTSDAAATITSTSATSLSDDICPTGFYQCSAYYHGGCCRVGRDCSLTSCPTSATTTVVDTNGVVIVAPTGSGIGPAGEALGTGNCADGWFTCAASDGGGCCLSGYACGQSCTATATGISATASIQPKMAVNGSRGLSVRFGWERGVLIIVTMMVGFGMML